jgi:hypothetical protein
MALLPNPSQAMDVVNSLPWKSLEKSLDARQG